MNRAYVLTHWIGTGASDDPNRPAFADEHPRIGWLDVTSQSSRELPLDVNAFVIACTCTDEQLAEIEACPECLVLHSEPVPDPSVKRAKNG